MTSLIRSETVAVIGAGAMGSGIAHVAARAGHPVLLFDMNAEAIERGIGGIGRDLDFLVSKGRLDAGERDAVLARIVPATALEGLADAALIIEAIVENLDVKRTLFAQLERIAPDAILASNTSSLSITAIGAALEAPERLAGLHFFNPAPRMRWSRSSLAWRLRSRSPRPSTTPPPPGARTPSMHARPRLHRQSGGTPVLCRGPQGARRRRRQSGQPRCRDA